MFQNFKEFIVRVQGEDTGRRRGWFFVFFIPAALLVVGLWVVEVRGIIKPVVAVGESTTTPTGNSLSTTFKAGLSVASRGIASFSEQMLNGFGFSKTISVTQEKDTFNVPDLKPIAPTSLK